MLLPFELDPQIIHHIIYSQAGSIGKAVIELLMNSVDAEATAVRLEMTKEGFHCSDDGRGFATRKDVLRYFGRFGTPHQEGDATYGRFRLGRGQIMAHATTDWRSNLWKMAVDTRSMGYNYELDDLSEPVAGCSITGTWYERLNDMELMSAVQEIRDLVRYTPISVELNGKLITRDARAEKWDFEDDFAYYRTKEEGAVSIYNQGVLVRHDSSHLWGCGGLIVSKRAVNLNVSRTEILRKTCPIWKGISKEFSRLASEVTGRQGKHRKTEASREKAAHSLMSGGPRVLDIFRKDEVITLLPGKRHVTLASFVQHARINHRNTYTVASGNDVPKGEAIAQQGVIQVVNGQTLTRFGCHNVSDFEEALQQILEVVTAAAREAGSHRQLPWLESMVPQLVAFSTLKEAFIERTLIVDEKKVLDKEARRAWIALRWCLQHYAGACMGAPRYADGTVRYGENKLHILLGESNAAEAWTDGQSYLAINASIVKRLKTDPLKTAAYIFGLVEHEVAHQGDSLESGHDEAFYQRYHDISINMSPERQRFLHKWLMKYTMSMETEGKKARGNAWGERYLMDRVGSGRMKRGLTPVLEDLSASPVVTTEPPEPNMALMVSINNGLIEKGLCAPPPDWAEVLKQARADQLTVNEVTLARRAREAAQSEADRREVDQMFIDAQPYIAHCLELELAVIPPEALAYLCDIWVCHGCDEQDIRQAWLGRHWEEQPDHDYIDDHWPDWTPEQEEEMERVNAEFEASEAERDPRSGLDADCRDLVQEGETLWMLERNAAAAGFWRIEQYLKWRSADQL